MGSISLSWLVLGLFVLVEATPARALILCRADGDHLALENAEAFARCHAADPIANVDGREATTLVQRGGTCVDIAVLPAAADLARWSSVHSIHDELFVPAHTFGRSAVSHISGAPVRFAAPYTADRVPRLLRSVILLV